MSTHTLAHEHLRTHTLAHKDPTRPTRRRAPALQACSRRRASAPSPPPPPSSSLLPRPPLRQTPTCPPALRPARALSRARPPPPPPPPPPNPAAPTPALGRGAQTHTRCVQSWRTRAHPSAAATCT
eukprot:5012869-Pleurochrysis_carterae.AAC.1